MIATPATASMPVPEPADTASAPPIESLDTSVTAFIGRTLRGPVDTPIRVGSFQDFERQFGGLWQPSTLSYAVEQYFEQGGRHAVVVRVCSGARAPSLQLPCNEGSLRLRGLAPGTREYLRASVDYDGIASSDFERFNLVLQRVRAPGTEQIEAQEIFRRVSLRPAAQNYLGDAMANSQLARLESANAGGRPLLTTGDSVANLVGYIDSEADGDDGEPLNDYDIIGSADEASGLFALGHGSEHFSMLCVPPLERARDVGYPVLVVAARVCRQRQALLLVDPPAHWESAEAAFAGLAAWPFQSADACMYFPRVIGFDRLRGQMESFASCGAVAGLLAHGDERCPVWGAAAGEEPLLRSPLRPAVAVADSDRERLLRLGVNTLRVARGSPHTRSQACTLVPEGVARPERRLLALRRLSLYVTGSLQMGTRWALLEHSDAQLWRKLRTQVDAFLESVAHQGALVGDCPEDGYFVVCDLRVNGAAVAGPREINLLFGIAPMRAREFQAWLITHRPSGSSVRAVSVNRLLTDARDSLEGVETAIMRSVLPHPVAA